MQKHHLIFSYIWYLKIYKINKKLINLSQLQTIYAGELCEVIILL